MIANRCNVFPIERRYMSNEKIRKYERSICETMRLYVKIPVVCTRKRAVFYKSALSFPAKTMLRFQLIIILLGFPKNGV